MVILGIGQDNEPVAMEIVHKECVLIHVAGNSQSPFEFGSGYTMNGMVTAEQNARNFAALLYKCKVEDDMERAANLFGGNNHE